MCERCGVPPRGWRASVSVTTLVLVVCLLAGCSRKSADRPADAGLGGAGSGSGGSGTSPSGTGGAAGLGQGGSTHGGAGTANSGGIGGASGSIGGSGSGGHTAGASGTGGTLPMGVCDGGSCLETGGDAGITCPDVIACGGDLVGTWTVTSSCLRVGGQLDVRSIGLACVSMPVTGSLRVTGSWTATSDGELADNTVTVGDELITVTQECVARSGTIVYCRDLSKLFPILGYASATCMNAQPGPDFCYCPATVNQNGGAGLVSSEPPLSGRYTTAGNVMTTDTGAQYSYCVSGNTMTWTPLSASPTVTGTIVFRKQ